MNWRVLLLSVYAAGALLLLLRLGVGTIQANRLRRSALTHAGRLTSDRCTTPITVGWLTPILILPRGWDRWSTEQLTVVFTHEGEHARRRDPLTQWLALLNRAVFWFHPLAWWLERKLATLAEEACDAAVLAAGHSPQHYSQYLLDMARTVSRQHGRVRIVGMAMPGTGLSSRLHLILHGLPSVRISRTRLAVTITSCAISLVVFASGTLAERQLPLLSPTSNASTVAEVTARKPEASQLPTRHERAGATPGKTPGATKPRGQTSQVPSTPQMQIVFEAVSIRPCDPATQGGGRGGGGSSPRFAITPGYVSWGCVTLAELVENAYGGAGRLNSLLNTLPGRPGSEPDRPQRIRGGPSWINEDRFAIEIRISGDTTSAAGSIRHDEVNRAMTPALRAMLEDRFKLKVRKMTEERPMYALSVVAGGHKLKPAQPADCVSWKEGMPGPRPSRAGLLDGKWICGVINATMPLAVQERFKAGDRSEAARAMSPDRRMEGYAVTVQDLALHLATMMDRYVIDKSGVDGAFTFAFEYTANDNTPRTGWGMLAGQPDWPAGNVVPAAVGRNQNIFKSLEALGLELEPTRGPGEYLFIESAQRPGSAFRALARQARAMDAWAGQPDR